jgi:hypothetical protein
VAGAVVAFGAGVALVALGFGVAAGAVTVWVTTGAAAGAFAEPHAARPRPAANAMAGTAMNFLLSFIVLAPTILSALLAAIPRRASPTIS